MCCASLLVRVCRLRRLLWQLYMVRYRRRHQRCNSPLLPLAAMAASLRSWLAARVMSLQAPITYSRWIAGPQLSVDANLGRMWGDVIAVRGDGHSSVLHYGGPKKLITTEVYTSPCELTLSKLSPCEKHPRSSLQRQDTPGSNPHANCTRTLLLRLPMALSTANIHPQSQHPVKMSIQIHLCSPI